MRYSKSQKALVLASLAICALSLTAHTASALQCKSTKTSVDSKKAWTNLGARANARWKWHRKAKSRYGLVWSTWVRAKSKSYNCHRVRAKWRCTANARPCRPF
jgi:hypothetical protein